MALEQILTRTRADVAARMLQTSQESLAAKCWPSTRSLVEALSGPDAGFIMECKKASPSRGMIRADFNLTQIIDAYRPFAAAISVLTDEPFFQGSRQSLAMASALCPQPILCKDFIVEPYQLYEARAYGADAVLLMLSVLDDAQYRRCAQVAQTLGLDVLTEVHDLEELERALALDAKIIGINNRDLRTLKVDLETTRRLAPKLPADRVVICESGVFSHEQVRALASSADGFLVGTSLMQRADLERAVRELVFGKVKVCGLTREQDALAAYRFGATFGGLICSPVSKRHISLARGRALVEAVPQLDWVGVFVNQSTAEILAHVEALRLSAVQLHGDEDEGQLYELRQALAPHVAIWRAAAVQPGQGAPMYKPRGVDRLLLDTFDLTQRGGTGRSFDWSLIPEHMRREVILSGGLGPENIADAAALGTWAVDLNSKLEQAPGLKDEDLMRQCFGALRAKQGRQGLQRQEV